jgi:8-oxo-dGTP pyrophosphatase MutT (NUDIX family)
MDILEFNTNPFRGAVTKTDSLPEDPVEFRIRLGHSLESWRGEGLQTVWMEIPTALAPLIPVAVDAGFNFHHSSDQYLMLTCQLVPDAFIPPFATHYIGAGGVVLNEDSELLLVCERFRRPGQAPFYKLPGGALHPGEHLADAVVREVLEETGVQTRFDALVCFRHWHGYRYGKSDIYFVCRLSPLSREITMQAEEIEECLWMPSDQFLASDDVITFNKSIVRAALDSPGIVSSWIEGVGDPETREFFMPSGGSFG